MLPRGILCLHNGGIVPHVHSVELISGTSGAEHIGNVDAIVLQRPLGCTAHSLMSRHKPVLMNLRTKVIVVHGRKKRNSLHHRVAQALSHGFGKTGSAAGGCQPPCTHKARDTLMKPSS
jgi:hypothetical protein